MVHRSVQGNSDIWLLDGTRTAKLTFDAASDRWPVWSPDGSRIVFDSSPEVAELVREIVHWRRTGTEELLLEPSAGQSVIAADWSADGRFLLYLQSDPNTAWDLWVLPIGGDRKPWAFLEDHVHRDAGQVLAGRALGGVHVERVGPDGSVRAAVCRARVGRRNG